MTQVDKLLARMRKNPKDWRIADLERLARQLGMKVRKKGGGSHVIFQHEVSVIEVSVPARRPIKPIYIKKFLELIDDIIGGSYE
ncbi:MAG: type II toxin-antitoxin system HicA family toxin [Deltaproteobacteria bacterium]|nr:type II toxin-antitoxin system HicA family toxin [Deltaproteobacteria bacterium]